MYSSDIRQSPRFASFMQDIGWRTQQCNGEYIYLRRFPFFGSFAKAPRIEHRDTVKEIIALSKREKLFKIKIAVNAEIDNSQPNKWHTTMKRYGFSVEPSPFNPTTTILVDLNPKEDIIFSRFTSAKRRAVRRALKNDVFVRQTDNLDAFIHIRQQQYKPMGFLVTGEMKSLWNNFHPASAALLLAYSKQYKNGKEALGGILLLFHNSIAYYWYASALPIGKSLFAPTLLVWEALKVAKKRKCTTLDFEGVYDERFPKASESWWGFTKFKEGFGGKTLVLMENFTR